MPKFIHSRYIAILVAVIIYAAAPVSQSRKEKEKMCQIPLEPTPLETILSGTEPVTITSSTIEEEELKTAKPSDDDRRFRRPFANDALNSRISFVWPEDQARILWQAPLDPKRGPAGLLSFSEERILVWQSGWWQLFGSDGKQLESGQSRYGDPVIHPSGTCFFLIERDGALACYLLSTGSAAYFISLPLGNLFYWPWIAFHEQKAALLGIMQNPSIHDPGSPPPFSRIDILEMDKRPPLDKNLDVTSFVSCRSFSVDQAPTLAATFQGQIFLAHQDALYILDWNGTVHHYLKGNFMPQAMSVDEAMRMHLIVADDEGNSSLWIVTAQGRRIREVRLPEGMYAPPIISYDHHVYCTTQERIIAINPKGEVAWAKSPWSPFGGVLTMADGRLLVSEGCAVTAWDVEGERNVIYAFQGEEVTSQPLLVAPGELYVATRSHLYRLGLKK